MIKTAVKEAVSGVLTEVQLSAVCSQSVPALTVPTVRKTPKKSFPAKLKEPNNWDSILDLWKGGKLSTVEASKIAGMSESSFRAYATGKKTFG